MKTKLLLVLAGGIILFANQTLAADATTNFVSQTNEPSPFKITVTPTKKEFHINEIISIHIKIENVTKVDQSVVMWSCSWWMQFPITNEQLRIWPGYICDSNVPLAVDIPPGKPCERELKLVVSGPVPTNRISFRVRFVPLDYTGWRSENGQIVFPIVKDSKTSYLSDEATIHLIPN